ncbi:MAG: trehalase family glycosidase [Candidatus Scatosoma sp.]
MTKNDLNRVNEYIKEHWKNTVRRRRSKENEIILPYPFSVPCENQRYTYFFYWDTYFINAGLLYDMPDQALNNLRNMKFLIERYGFMPNANLTCMLNRSQPPLYCSAVYDYYLRFRCEDTVREFYPTMEKEYGFWMSKRTSECGLNRYTSNASDDDVRNFIYEVSGRGILNEEDPAVMSKSRNLLAEAESGWDFTPRFNGKALDFAPIDLNAMLYRNERILSEFSALSGTADAARQYAQKADARRALIERQMKNGQNFYTDYDFAERSLSDLLSAAGFLPYWAGISRDKKACVQLAETLEGEFGMYACEKSEGNIYQWDYPNMWPPLVYFAVSALREVGAVQEAVRLAKKYLSTVALNFVKDGCLYEKYSAVTGRYSEIEYQSPQMLGWTAGVYRHLYEFIGGDETTDEG